MIISLPQHNCQKYFATHIPAINVEIENTVRNKFVILKSGINKKRREPYKKIEEINKLISVNNRPSIHKISPVRKTFFFNLSTS